MSNAELKIYSLAAAGALSSVPSIPDDRAGNEKEFALREEALKYALDNFVSLTGAVIEETPGGHQMELSGVVVSSEFGRSKLLSIWHQAANDALSKESNTAT